jgi:anti-sigma-K factor RskA
MFAQIRHESDANSSSATRTRRWRASWVAAAAVIGIAAGGGAVFAAEHIGNGSSAQAVALAAYDQGTRPASAKIVGGDEMKLDATALPALPQGKRYEVWLTDAARQHMQPLGWVGTNGRSDLTVPGDLMNRFSAIEVSVQDVTAPYQYSGVSVLRGSYR